MKSFSNKSKYFWISILLLSILFKPLWLFEKDNIDPQDDLSYWLHGYTLSKDFDISYIDDFTLESSIFDEDTNAPSHFPGSGYATSPFIFLFSIIDNAVGNEVDRLNPTKSFSYLGYFAGTLFYCLLGFYLLSKIVRKNKYFHYPFLYFILLFSTLVHFVTTRFLMSHSFEFFLCSLLIYIYETKKNLLKPKHFFYLILCYFLIALTRPSTFLYSLILFGAYVSISDFQIKNIDKIINLFTLSFFASIYLYLNKIIYNDYFVLFNLSNNSTTSGIVDDFNFNFFVSGLIKIPNLIFSTSMGLIWIMPTLVLSILLLFTQKLEIFNISRTNWFFLLLYFFAAVSVLFIWQGREVAYGQRLLIGLLPISFLLISKVKIKIKIPWYLLSSYLYLSYLYFYSPNLTLVEGETLWGNLVKFAPTNYTINLLSNFYHLENIFYVSLKNIYSINFFNIFDSRLIIENNLVQNILADQSSYEKLVTTINYYAGVNTVYLVIANILIITFCYLFTKISLNIYKTK